jgi:hypothetical protein
MGWSQSEAYFINFTVLDTGPPVMGLNHSDEHRNG